LPCQINTQVSSLVAWNVSRFAESICRNTNPLIIVSVGFVHGVCIGFGVIGWLPMHPIKNNRNDMYAIILIGSNML
jgi:hypothetical protein